MPLVFKSFRKYQGSIEKMRSRNRISLQAKLCNKRWCVESLLMSVGLLFLLRRLLILINTYNVSKQNISNCHLSLSSCFLLQTNCSLSISPHNYMKKYNQSLCYSSKVFFRNETHFGFPTFHFAYLYIQNRC